MLFVASTARKQVPTVVGNIGQILYNTGMSTLDEALVAIGLNDKEAALYLLLLSAGSSPASALGKRAGIVRSTAQFTCQQLVEKGLAKMSRKGNVQIFSCEPPEKLLYLLARRKRDVQDQEDRMRALMGDLKALMNPQSVLPRVHFYEGSEGVRLAHQAILDALPDGGEIMGYMHPLDRLKDAHGLMPNLDSFTRERVRRGIRSRLITPVSAVSERMQKHDADVLRETRAVPGLQFGCETAQTLIYGDAVNSLKVVHGTIFAYVVQDADFAALQAAGFELAWRAAGTL